MSYDGEDRDLVDAMEVAMSRLDVDNPGDGFADLVCTVARLTWHPLYHSSSYLQDEFLRGRDFVFDLERRTGRDDLVNKSIGSLLGGDGYCVAKFYAHMDLPMLEAVVFPSLGSVLEVLVTSLSRCVGCDDVEEFSVVEMIPLESEGRSALLDARVDWPGSWSGRLDGRLVRVYITVDGADSDDLRSLYVRHFD